MTDAAHTPTAPPDAPPALTGARRTIGVAFAAIAMGTAILAGFQIALAGIGAFGGTFAPHRVLGYIIALLTLLILIAALISRPGRRLVIMAVVLFVLAVLLQPTLAGIGEDGTSWVGGLHALNGVLIFGLSGSLGSAVRSRMRAAG